MDRGAAQEREILLVRNAAEEVHARKVDARTELGEQALPVGLPSGKPRRVAHLVAADDDDAGLWPAALNFGNRAHEAVKAAIRLQVARDIGDELRLDGAGRTDQIGVDAIEIRRRNLIDKSAMPYSLGFDTLGTNIIYDSGDYVRLMDRLLAAADWPSTQRTLARQRDHRVQLAAYRVEPLEGFLRQRHGRDASRANVGAQLADGAEGEAHQSARNGMNGCAGSASSGIATARSAARSRTRPSTVLRNSSSCAASSRSA